MNLFVLRWNPKVSSLKKEDLATLISHLNDGEVPLNFEWSITDWKKLKKGDLFIMQQVGTKNDGIAMIGKFQGKCTEGESWREDGTKVHYARLWIMTAFDCNKKNVLPAERYEKLFPEITWHEGHSGVLIEERTARFLMWQIESDLITAHAWTADSLEDFINLDYDRLAEENL